LRPGRREVLGEERAWKQAEVNREGAWLSFTVSHETIFFGKMSLLTNAPAELA
jgi:hypothetical protein